MSHRMAFRACIYLIMKIPCFFLSVH